MNVSMSLGVYIAVPFCRTKCSYCNFASDVFSRAVFERYIERVCEDIRGARQMATNFGAVFKQDIDSIYFGGGTPTVLDASQLLRIFDALRETFSVESDAEVTVECAPGTLAPATIDALVECGVNRVSLGVQSFVDGEASAVGRLHKKSTVLEDIARLRASGIGNLNIDLIAGLPHQTNESWRISVEETIASGSAHASVYLLEVDEDSRLGRELIAGGQRYHAHFVPDEDATADFYLEACERLNSAGIAQYEISNFARAGFESKHNLKYWTRQPYIGFGVDAHSMLTSLASQNEAVRLAAPDSLERYLAKEERSCTAVSCETAREETFFLGLRLRAGVSLQEVATQFGASAVEHHHAAITELIAQGLIERIGDLIRLTQRGTLLSNEVFQQFLMPVSA